MGRTSEPFYLLRQTSPGFTVARVDCCAARHLAITGLPNLPATNPASPLLALPRLPSKPNLTVSRHARTASPRRRFDEPSLAFPRLPRLTISVSYPDHPHDASRRLPCAERTMLRPDEPSLAWTADPLLYDPQRADPRQSIPWLPCLSRTVPLPVATRLARTAPSIHGLPTHEMQLLGCRATPPHSMNCHGFPRLPRRPIPNRAAPYCYMSRLACPALPTTSDDAFQDRAFP